MKIAFISQPFEGVDPPVQINSVAIWTYQVSQRLTTKCNFIVYTRPGFSREKVIWHNSIQYRRISAWLDDCLAKPFKLLERFLGYPRPKRPFFSMPLYYLSYILQIARDLRRQKCDIVHIHNFSQFAPLIRVFNPKIRIVLHMHCEWLTQLDQKMIERRLEQIDLIIGCSKFITNKIQRRFPRFAGRCKTILNGVDAGIFKDRTRQNLSKDNLKRLLYVGRVSPEKGLHVLLEAFQEVVKEYPQVELNVIGPTGSAPYEFILLVSNDDNVTTLTSFYNHFRSRRHGRDYLTFLQSQIPNEATQKIHFLGPVSHSDLPEFYYSTNAFIFPSVWHEPFGIPLVEAMACRTPVIATRSGGMPEIIEHGKTGLLVERGNAQALADAILQLLQNDDLSLAMGQAGRERVLKHFTWNSIAQELLAQYEVLYNNRDHSQNPIKNVTGEFTSIPQ